MKFLAEGIHYYLEDGKTVFTEEFHRLRGKCCGSGCRHCPFPKEQQERKDKIDKKQS